MSAVRLLPVAALTALCLSLGAGSAIAETIPDPLAAMHWDDLLASELVMVGKYRDHQPGKLSLEVVRVLRGKASRPGDVLTVTLQHWYSVEIGPVGFERRGDGKADGFPRLCYKAQIERGEPVPVAVLKDVRHPAVYFFPKAATPALTRRRQVQPPYLADGWQQALDKRPMDLGFRLVQSVNSVLARDALEELYAARDPHTLDLLFARVLDPPHKGDLQNHRTPERILCAVGDRKGDIYERALKHFAAAKPGVKSEVRYALGRILATVDRDRAADDFARFVASKSPELRRVAADCVGVLYSQKGLDLACKMLRNPALADAGIATLRIYEYGSYGIKGRTAEVARLRESTRARVRAAVKSADLSEPIKRRLREGFRDLFAERPKLDLARAEKILLDPNEKVYAGRSEGEAYQIYDSAIRYFDPKFVPLLVRVLREMPTVKLQKAYRVRDAHQHYANICPEAMRRELANQVVNQKNVDVIAYPTGLYVDLVGLLRGLQAPNRLHEAGHQRWGRAWLRRKQVPLHLIQALQQRIDGALTPTGGGPLLELSWWHIRLLLRIDPVEGRRMLEQALVRGERLPTHERAYLTALGVRYGYTEYRDELIRMAMPPALVLAEDDKALVPYLKFMDARRIHGPTRFDLEGDRRVYTYSNMLRELFPTFPSEFFSRIGILLESPHLPDRTTAVELLESTLHWDLGFIAEDFAAVRAEKLVRIRPLLKRLAGLSEGAMRVAVLRKLGVLLDGQPGAAWIPVLTKAVVSEDPAVAANALLVLEEVAQTPGCYEFRSLPPAERARVLQARLRDEEEGRPKPARLTRARLEALWADMGEPLPRAYWAAAALIASAQDSLPFLKERLRPAQAGDTGKIKRLIADLDSRTFAVREKATLDLEKLGEQPVPLLRKALKAAGSLESRRRLEGLLKRLEGWSVERQRVLRAVDVLESLGTPPAREVLRAIAEGVPEAFLTEEARAALRRLARRSFGF
jgi:hypothetical protein